MDCPMLVATDICIYIYINMHPRIVCRVHIRWNAVCTTSRTTWNHILHRCTPSKSSAAKGEGNKANQSPQPPWLTELYFPHSPSLTSLVYAVVPHRKITLCVLCFHKKPTFLLPLAKTSQRLYAYFALVHIQIHVLYTLEYIQECMEIFEHIVLTLELYGGHEFWPSFVIDTPFRFWLFEINFLI